MMTIESSSRLETVDNARALCLSENVVADEAARTAGPVRQSDSALAASPLPIKAKGEGSIDFSQGKEYLVIVAFVFFVVAFVFGITKGAFSAAISTAFSAVVVQLNSCGSPSVPKK